MALNYPTDPVPEFSYMEELDFKTLVSQFENGTEQRRSKWSQGRRMFTIRYNVRTREEIDRLWNFYLLCKGSYAGFGYQRAFYMIPYDQVMAWWPLHEGQLTRADDWNGFIYPTLPCRFAEDKLSYEEFSLRVQRTGIKIYQYDPIFYTNNFGTLSGGATWGQCPDGSACVSFDGSSGQIATPDCAGLDVGTGDFSLALCLYTNSLASAVGVLSKKTDSTLGSKGYQLSISTAGTISFLFSDGTVQRTLTSAVGVVANQTWKIIAITIAPSGNGQIYANDVASGSPVSIASSASADNGNNFYIGRAEGLAFGNLNVRNCLFAKKAWTQTDIDLIWNTWRGIFKL